MAHTPGPWKTDGHWLTTEGNMPIFELCAVVGLPTEHEANARLIAAAPDLLAVAKHCLELFQRYEINRIDGEEISDAVLCLLRAAISKASGSQS